jgi:hypothetical protein
MTPTRRFLVDFLGQLIFLFGLSEGKLALRIAHVCKQAQEFPLVFFFCAASELPIVRLTDPLTVARQNVAYTTGSSGCPPLTTWTSQSGSSIQYTVFNCFDGNLNTFCHQDSVNAAYPGMSSLTFTVDLQEPRMITTVGLATRGDCCNWREDGARVILMNTEAKPESVIGATECTNPGGGFGLATYRNYNCIGSPPARFAVITLFCITVSYSSRLVFYTHHTYTNKKASNVLLCCSQCTFRRHVVH